VPDRRTAINVVPHGLSRTNNMMQGGIKGLVQKVTLNETP
jgi:hypothetical protein